MSTNRKTLFGLALLAALLLTVSVAQARNWGGYGAGPGMRGPAVQQPQLTPEKQAAVDKIVAEHEKTFLALREQLDAKSMEFRGLVDSGKGDEKTIRALSQEIAKLHTQMYENRQALGDALEKETGYSFGPGMGFGPGGRGLGPCGGGAAFGPGKGGGPGYAPCFVDGRPGPGPNQNYGRGYQRGGRW